MPPVNRPAPAKINLSLKVLGKRPDGFHELETLMAPISLADELEITKADQFEFTCSDTTLPVDENNLVVRAVRLFCRATGRAPKLRIHLNKKVPHGAGLGGGSSDAATTLLALDELFETRLGQQALVAMSAELGSDVPFFIYHSAAICRGRGELVTPVSLGISLPLLLLKPEFGVPTPWAYQKWANSRELPDVPYTPQVFPWGTLVNDLERPVFEKYIFLALLKRWLLAQPECGGALMSGSGSTVFALLHAPSTELAERVRAEFGPNLWMAPCVAQL